MTNKSEKINVTNLLEGFKASGQHELVRKLQEKALKTGVFWEEDEFVVEAGELLQTLSDFGQRDLVRNLKKSMEESENEQIERLRDEICGMMEGIREHCKMDNVQKARTEYEAVKELIRSRRQDQPRLKYLITPTPLINAYIRVGKPSEAFKLFAEESREIAGAAEEKWLQEAALAVSEVDDFGKLIDAGQKVIVEQESNEEARIQMRRWFLEYIVVGCYSSINFDLVRRLKESKSTLRYKDDDISLKLSAAIKNATTSMFKPEEAFQRFRSAFKELADLYEDKKLQEAVLAYREVNDVWKRHREVRQLAERYQNPELQKQFLELIAGSCGECILYYSETGNLYEAQAAYENLKQLVATHEEKKTLSSVDQARGAGNLVYAYVTAQKPEEALTAYKELRMLSEKLQGNPKLRFLRANRASDVIYAYATAQKPEEGHPIYDELRQLAESHPDDPKLLVWQATGAFDLTYGYAKAGKSHEARAMFHQLEELTKDKNVAEVMQQKKIEGIPKIEWLRQLLQKHPDS